jgi:hypothetical protein
MMSNARLPECGSGAGLGTGVEHHFPKNLGKPTLNMAWEVSIAYFGVKSLCNVCDRKVWLPGRFPSSGLIILDAGRSLQTC